MVILLSTRGTAGSDIWFVRLAEEPLVRSYHLRDYVRIPPRRSDTHAPKCFGWSGVAGALGSRVAEPFVTGSGCGRKSAAPLLTLHRMFVKNLVLNHSETSRFWVRVSYVAAQLRC